jgi:2-dehydro-3-deoxyglucarate aldolase
MNASFKQKLNRGDLLIGTIMTLASPEIGEIYSRCGFDWLFIDMEHSALSIREAQTLLLAAGQTPCAVRVPCIDETRIKKALDGGAAGVIIPQVNSAEEASRAVRLCKYPPEGSRGAGVWQTGWCSRGCMAPASPDALAGPPRGMARNTGWNRTGRRE